MYPGNFQDSQIRTFQRKVKQWRAQKGPAKEVYFAQVYRPGDWSESDFTSMNSLNITIAGCPFNHLLYGTPTCQDQKSSCLRCYPVALSNPLSVPATLRVA